jgi:diguanylate cyclase (GGDEF)-like protein/PAS domain S-box-containing protein
MLKSTHLLKWFLLLFVTAIIMLGLYDFFYVHPSFTALITENTEKEAIRIATHMQSMLITAETLASKNDIPADFNRHLKALQGDFGFIKVKVFSPSGEVLYSTDPKDLGYVNKEKYFHEIVMKGKPYSKVVQKGAQSLERQTFQLHVAEAYVPIIRGSRIAGVFEIYLDVTDAQRKLKNVILSSRFSLFGMALGLLAVVIMLSCTAGKALAERERIETELRQMQKAVETMHIGITITDTEGRIINMNPAEAAMHGYAVEELTGKDARIFAPPDNWKPIRFDEMKAFKYWERESVNIRKDGSLFPVYLASDVILNDRGEPIGITTACVDITERKHTERQIIRQGAALKELNYELSVLHSVSSAISRTIDLNELLPIVLSVVTGISVFAVQRKAGIFIIEGDRMKLASHLGHTDEFLALHKNIKVGDCLCGLAAKTGEIIVSKNSAEDSRHSITYTGPPHGHVILPLKAAAKTVGVLYLYMPRDLEINEERMKILSDIGSQVGIAIENAKLYEETKALSLHDPLTGLANRRMLDIIFERNFIRARRFSSPLSVLMLDIDHFKKYNDAYGHLAGDRLLCEVADTTLKEIRETDLVARYGGEEFIVLLPDTDITHAHEAAERIRKAVEKKTRITVSIGVSTHQHGMREKEELLDKTDAALYKAKHNGRNRVEAADA